MMGSFVVSLLFLVSFSAFGQGKISSSLLEVKSRLEKDIQANLENTISTRLEKGTFTVAVQMKLSEIPPEKTPEPPKPETSDRPLGLDLGAINIDELLASYERELHELRLRQEKKEGDKSAPPKFNIDRITVDVGLSERYDEGYRGEFATWLKSKLGRDFGRIASTSVDVIKEQPKEEPKPETPKTPLDHLKDLQQLAGFLALGLILTTGLFLVARGLVKAAREQRKMALQTASPLALDMKGAGMPALEAPAETEEMPQIPDVLPSPAMTEGLTTKIAFVCIELRGKLNELVRVWIDSGEEGLLKTALLVDAMMNAREKMLTQAGAMPMLQIPIDEDIVVSREESLAEAYRQVAQMDLAARTPYLEQIYWDLISVRTLGLQSLRRPFDFLSGMETKQVQELLLTQKQESRALAVLYMNEDSRTELFETVEAEEKERLIGEILAHSQMPQQSIWDSDTAVKVSAMNYSEPSKNRVVNLFPRTLEVLSVLSSLDEIEILRRVTPSLPDQGTDLKIQYPSLAFIDEWNPDFVRKLMNTASADEITALIRILPDAKESLLEQCAPKVKMIVEDDLKIQATDDRAATTAKIGSLKKKWLRLVQNEKISLNKVFSQGAAEGGAYAA